MRSSSEAPILIRSHHRQHPCEGGGKEGRKEGRDEKRKCAHGITTIEDRHGKKRKEEGGGKSWEERYDSHVNTKNALGTKWKRRKRGRGGRADNRKGEIQLQISSLTPGKKEGALNVREKLVNHLYHRGEEKEEKRKGAMQTKTG